MVPDLKVRSLVYRDVNWGGGGGGGVRRRRRKKRRNGKRIELVENNRA